MLRDRTLAKIWLNPVFLAGSTRFPPKDLRRIEKLVVENRDLLIGLIVDSGAIVTYYKVM